MDPIICYSHSLEVGANTIEEKLDVVYVKEKLDINTLVGPDEATQEQELIQDDSAATLEVQSEHVSSVISSFEDEQVVVTREEGDIFEVVAVPQASAVIIQTEESEEVLSSTFLFEKHASSTENTRTAWKEIESKYSPAIDIVELKDSYHIYAEVPGTNVKDITIDLSNNMFTLIGDKRDHCFLSRYNNEGAVVQEINKGKFKRVLELPENVDANGVSVAYEEGIIQLKIRKIDEGSKEKTTVEDRAEEEGIQKEEIQKEERGGNINDDKEISEGSCAREKRQADKMKHKRSMTKGGKKRSSCSIQ